MKRLKPVLTLLISFITIFLSAQEVSMSNIKIGDSVEKLNKINIEKDEYEIIEIESGSSVNRKNDGEFDFLLPDGNLIYTGTDLTVSPLITQTYKLEVITETDGFKDYDEVTVTVNPYKIQSLIPNPASSQVTVNYDVEGASSAYIMLVNQTTGNSDNYILDIEETTVTIDISAYPTGLYSVVLVANGEIQSSKNLMIQQ